MSFDVYVTEDRRLVLLKALQASAQFTANAYLLQRFCDSLGHVVSTDRLEQDIAWLHEQALVVRSSTHGVTLAVLTPRGLDVATGRTKVPGVQAPQPGG